MPSLASLSDPALVRLWEHLLGDLPTHVALTQTCRRLRAVYCEEDDRWRAACFVAGFGRPLRAIEAVSVSGEPSWRGLACIIVKHADKCEISSCIKANACFADHYARLPYTRIRTLHPHHAVEFHPLYFYLHFSQNPQAARTHPSAHRRTASAHVALGLPSPVPTPTPSPSPSPSPPSVPDALSILLTHLPTFPECRYAQYGPLCVHPGAACAFATFPPVGRLEFENGEGAVFMVVENAHGCTVLDVNRALAQLIPVDEGHFEVALQHYQELAATSGLSLAEYAAVVSQDRGFLDDHEYPFLQHIVDQL